MRTEINMPLPIYFSMMPARNNKWWIPMIFLSAFYHSCQNPEIHSPQPNVLFIAVDDLRPELGCYGAQHIHSPNIDALASKATLFKNSYCNIPVCGASRASILTG